MFILWIITIIFFIITLVLLSGKGANFIAGFNSLPPEKKKKYNKKKLSRSVGLMPLLIDIALIFLSLYIQFRIIPAQNINELSNEITIVAIGFLIYVILLIIIWMTIGTKKSNLFEFSIIRIENITTACCTLIVKQAVVIFQRDN